VDWGFTLPLKKVGAHAVVNCLCPPPRPFSPHHRRSDGISLAIAVRAQHKCEPMPGTLQQFLACSLGLNASALVHISCRWVEQCGSRSRRCRSWIGVTVWCAAFWASFPEGVAPDLVRAGFACCLVPLRFVTFSAAPTHPPTCLGSVRFSSGASPMHAESMACSTSRTTYGEHARLHALCYFGAMGSVARGHE